MLVPNTDGQGGQTIYSRTASEFGYTVRQVSTNAAGEITFSSLGWQETLVGEVRHLSLYRPDGAGNFDATTLVDGKLVEFNAQYDAAREQFRATELKSINGQILDPAAAPELDATDLQALLDPARPWTPAADALITSLDPAIQSFNGWAPPQLTVTELDGGLTERRITLGSGAELTSVRDDDRRVLRVIYQRDDTDSTGEPRRTITTENRHADGSADGPVEDLRLRQTDTGNWLPQSRTWRSTGTDPDSGERSTTEHRTIYASDGFSATGSETATTRHDASGQLQSAQRTTYDGSGTTVLSQETTTRQADNSLRTDTRDGQGQRVGRRQVWVFDDGTALASDLDADGRAPLNAPLTPLVNAAAKDTGITVHDLAFGRGAAPWKSCSARCRRSRPRRGGSGDCYGVHSKQRPFDAGYGAKRP